MKGRKIAPEARNIYDLCCREGIWDSGKSWDDNCKYLCKKFPEVFDNQWELLKPYWEDNRGAHHGTHLGII